MTEIDIHVDDSKKPIYKDPAIIVSIFALLISGAAAYFSYTQTNRQNNVANQQELLTIVTNIAQAPVTLAQEQTSDPGNTSAQFGTDMSELANGEEAARFMSLLPSKDITPIEYYETGLALELGENYALALTYLGDATNQTVDPRSAANALRSEATINFDLGNLSVAEQDISDAEQAYNVHGSLPVNTANKLPDVTGAQYWNNVAYTGFYDASFFEIIQCPAAVTELQAAEKVITDNPDAVTVEITSIKDQDIKNLRSCPQLAAI
jgi:hypothetical protein